MNIHRENWQCPTYFHMLSLAGPMKPYNCSVEVAQEQSYSPFHLECLAFVILDLLYKIVNNFNSHSKYFM